MRSRDVLRLLGTYESRNITHIEADGSWPIVWERARGVHVWDADGKKYLDLTAAFGVAATGHANSRVVAAGRRQMARLLHAMGDVHPHALKAELARELSRVTFERWTHITPFRDNRANADVAARGKTIFCNSGFEAVEAALKTALLATGRRGVVAFEGAYHGLGYGALNTTHRQHFRGPFQTQLAEFGHFVPFPFETSQLDAIARRICTLFSAQAVGAILVEPIQTRGGINVPPPPFLPLLRRLCDEHGALLILDEVYTGMGRTGRWFACEHSHTAPDVICLGKALTGGFPLSACVGRADVMDRAWPAATGEAIHTSTFLGHPVGCAMALAQIKELRRARLIQRCASLGEFLVAALRSQLERLPVDWRVRGRGLLVGLELREPDGAPASTRAMRVIKDLLRRGFILLPEGEHANVISFTPPLIISEPQLRAAAQAVAEELRSHAAIAETRTSS